MLIDGRNLLYFVWGITLLSLFLFIPKNKIHLALVAFLFKLAMTWPLGLFVVDMGWIQYPIRFFENANKASFTFEYLVYPVLCVYLNVYFPVKKHLLLRMAYYTVICSVVTLVELFLLYNTNLIIYIHWDAYLTWITLFVTFYLNRQFCVWFFKSYNKTSKYDFERYK